MQKKISFWVNGKPVTLEADGDRMLLWVLRTELGLTGTKYSCGEGLCGACTVLLNGQAVQACQTYMEDIEGAEVVTIEGLEKDGGLHPLQEAFIEHDALQCGFCTSGMILKAHSLLDQNPRLSRAQIADGMEDNLCRCGAHPRILDAIEDAAGKMNGGKRS